MSDDMSPYYYLGINIFILILQILSIFGNGFIIVLFLKSKRLRKSSALRLIFLLSLTDWLFAFLSLPYIIYYIALWNPIELNYNAMYIITSSLPLTIQFKINLIITLSIALDRLQAMRFPVFYRGKNQILNTILTLFIGVIFASVDVTLEYVLTDIQQIPGCAAVGCFVSPTFKAYWGASNMTIGAIGILFTCFVYYELKKIQKKNKKVQIQQGTKEDRQLQQANRLSMGILLTGIIFMMLPSALVGIAEMCGVPVFKTVGPFYILCLLLAGVTNCVIYMTQHVEIKNATKAVFSNTAISSSNANETQHVFQTVASKIFTTRS